MVNLINNIITKQYGVKFKCKKVGKEKFYYLTSNKNGMICHRKLNQKM